MLCIIISGNNYIHYLVDGIKVDIGGFRKERLFLMREPHKYFRNEKTQQSVCNKASFTFI